VREVRTRRGLRLVEGDAVISEVLARPGPTHSVFDLLAACVAALAPGPAVALLGFGGGGMIAPLRAMGYRSAIRAVDLDLRSERIFRRVCGRWGGPVHFRRGDASNWLSTRRRRYDLIVEDLSVSGPDGVTKPAESLGTLPGLIRRKLDRDGLAVFNLLPVNGVSRAELLRRVVQPFGGGIVIRFREYDNRVVIVGSLPGTPRQVSWRLRARLRAIGSRLASEIAVGGFRPERD
jgi:spermidine synthase